ncbi:hypothetical protein MLD38_018620 [Melastoma candidum]|uniref:Uncharacterized protein n=1 Tax=Melastoma candidum TaxID=119954 RepID=A0ACB9R2N1_9MYRT|nr:hypothetical protein MLD38_018620 [Melastoma candidum]
MASVDLHLDATELRLGLPGTSSPEIEGRKGPVGRSIKRVCGELDDGFDPKDASAVREDVPRPSKTQVVGWPPVRSYRKNCFRLNKLEGESGCGVLVKVSMDGAPYLRKIDLMTYKGYSDLLDDLQDMFKFKVGEYSERDGYNGSEFVPTYEDKDGDWMLVGDVPWNMFTGACKRLRIMKRSDDRRP